VWLTTWEQNLTVKKPVKSQHTQADRQFHADPQLKITIIWLPNKKEFDNGK
jgi:hypothetical protein